MSSNWFLIQILKKLRTDELCNWTYKQPSESLFAAFAYQSQSLHISLDDQEVVRLQWDKADSVWKMRAKVHCVDALRFIRLCFVAFSAEVFLDISNERKPALYRLDSIVFEEYLHTRWCQPYVCSI
jgi:hypothetical protein